MKVLYVTKHNPWGIGGGSAASKMYLSAMLKVFSSTIIDLCIADTISHDLIPIDIKESPYINIIHVKERGFLSKILSPYTHILHRFQSVVNQLLNDNDYDYFISDHSSIAGSLDEKLLKKAKLIVVHHNFEPDYFTDNTPNFFIRSLLLPSVKITEGRAYRNAYLNLFLTQEDMDQFKRTYGISAGKSLVTGLFQNFESIESYDISHIHPKNPVIVITGSLDNVQNTDGIHYFIEELYPKIPVNVKIIVAGKNPNDTVKTLLDDKPNITLIPNPADMTAIIRQGSIFLSPARLGGGIKVRVTDGLSGGLPVLAHAVSARGYAPYISRGYFKVFSTPEEFAQKLSTLISEIQSGKYKPNEIQADYKQYSSIDVVVASIKKILNYSK